MRPINNEVKQATKGIRQETGKTQLQSQLATQGLSVEEVDSFMDFADKHPEKVRELDIMIAEFLKETGALVPKPNPAYQPVQ